MSQAMMISSLLNGHVIEIEENSTVPGGPVFPAPKAGLDASNAKAQGFSLEGPPPPLAANQTWEILPDPAGSKHFILKNPASGNCIDIRDNSVSPGAALDAYTEKNSDNQNQLWDLLSDPFGSSGFFVQNPQTGFVIEIAHGSDADGAALVVNPRRLFDSKRQLWSGIVVGGAVADGLPLLTNAEQPSPPLIGSGQYVLAPTDTSSKLTGITITLDIIEDLVAESFSVQINGNPPYPAPKGAGWQTQFWMQYGLFMQNNGLFLFTQVYPVHPKNQPAEGPLLTPSVQEASSQSMLQLQNNTVPAGTQIVLTLTIDSSNDYVTGVSGKVFDKSGSLIGSPDNWSAINQPTWSSNGPGATPNGPLIKELDLAPLGAFQVVVVGNPDPVSSGGGAGKAHFTAGMGTITVTCTPDISAQVAWPSPSGQGTGEQSNIFYGPVQDGPHALIAQPFGVPSPKLTPTGTPFSFSGTGLYPNSKLTATSAFSPGGGDLGPTVAGVVTELSPTSAPDGSFSLAVSPENASVLDDFGTTVAATVTDAYGNWAESSCVTSGWPDLGVSQNSGTSTILR